MVSRITSLAIVLVLAAAPMGCRNPTTGRPQMLPVSSEQERTLGEKGARQVEAEMGLLADREMLAYVERIGDRLAEEVAGDVAYEFLVVDSMVPNAFALPGGYVYVSRGLLTLVNGEDELAGVIGHEIGHVAARHAAERITLTAPLTIATGIGAIATGIVAPRLGNLIAGLGGLTTRLLSNPYSREQEREADRIGQELAAKAGWSPEGLPRFLETLAREEELMSGEVRRLDFFTSHPNTPSRVANGRRHAATLAPSEPRPIAGTRAALLERLEGLVVGPNPANGIVKKKQLLHPDLDFAVRFPKEWHVVNRPTVAGAIEPENRAQITLVLHGDGDDPMAAAEHFAEREKLEFTDGPSRATVGGLRAARATTRVRQRATRTHVELTWIAHAGSVYLLTGSATVGDRSHLIDPYEATVRTFRPLLAKERTSITVSRLRILPGRQDETLTDLVRRTDTDWDTRRVAVANAFETTVRLSQGQEVKVSLSEPYR